MRAFAKEETMERRPAKEPWLAVSLSWLVPGVGQCYAGAWVSGLLFLGGGFGLGLLALWQLASAHGHLFVASLLVAARLGVWFAGLFHAHYSGRKRNSSEAEQERRQSKDPFFAVFLTLIVPGVGHLYLAHWLGGALLLTGVLAFWLGSAVLFALASLPAAFCVAAVVFSTYQAGAALLAYRAGRTESRRSAAGILGVCLLAFGMGMLPVAAAMVSRQYAIQAFRLSGASMSPALEPGDRNSGVEMRLRTSSRRRDRLSEPAGPRCDLSTPRCRPCRSDDRGSL